MKEEEKLVLRHLRVHGPTSRSGLTSAVSISSTKLTIISRGLLELGFIEEVLLQDERGRGRPAVPLRLSRQGGYAFGATVHKGVLEIALLAYNGDVIDLEAHEFSHSDPVEFGEFVRPKMHELAGKHRLLASRLLGVGISVPGPAMSSDLDRWWTVDELIGWRGIPLRKFMEDALGIPVWIGNDANLAALAEFYLGGLNRFCRTAIVILLGYGVGAGIIVDGNILQGETGAMGEIGVLYPNQEPRPTTLDLLATLKSAGIQINSVAEIEAMSDASRYVLGRWISRAAGQLVPLIKNGFAWFDPGAIVISSPLPAEILQQLAGTLNGMEMFQQRPSWARAPHVTVSKLGGSASTFGAALLPIHAVAQL